MKINLENKIKLVRDSIVAIGVLFPLNKVKIIGSGFSIIDEKQILTANNQLIICHL